MLLWAKHALQPWKYPKNEYLTVTGGTSKRDGKCRRCHKVIPLHSWSAWDGKGEEVPLESRTTENGLDLHLVGGYGEFYDVWDTQPVVCLCHECAHDLMDWIGVDASDFHTHNPDSGQHPDHHRALKTQYVICGLCGIEKDSTKECGYPCA